MEIFHLTHDDYQSSRWSGGTTTCLYLYPPNGDYPSRRFRVRISSAVIELPESDFTPLEGVTRFITPLEGGFTLTHGDGHGRVMSPLDRPYRFSGDLPTHSVGRATDFNLMLKDTAGDMTVERGQLRACPGLNAYYTIEACKITCGDRLFDMQAGELLLVFTDTGLTLSSSKGPIICCYAALMVPGT